jgi:hypothetical protein
VVGAYYTLADGEVDVLRRLPTPAGRLATAVAVAAIRWSGFVPADLGQAPAAGVQRLAGQLDADPDELGSYVPAERTAREHRQRAARIARFRDADERDLARLEELLVVSALEHDSPLALLRTAALRLRERSCCALCSRRLSGRPPPPGRGRSARRASSGSTSTAARRDGWTRWASSIGARPTWTTRGHTAAVRGSFSALLGDEDDLYGRDALTPRVAAAGDHGVVVDSVTVSVLL